MKHIKLICLIAAIAVYLAGFATSLIVVGEDVSSYLYKQELINAQREALEKAEEVMGNNNLYDIDGTDTMDDYYILKAKADDLWSKY
jgi:hypothetical protein